MKIKIKDAVDIGNKLNIDFKIIKPKEWRNAMQVELEHGTINKLTNVTNNNLVKTGKIALTHIL